MMGTTDDGDIVMVGSGMVPSAVRDRHVCAPDRSRAAERMTQYGPVINPPAIPRRLGGFPTRILLQRQLLDQSQERECLRRELAARELNLQPLQHQTTLAVTNQEASVHLQVKSVHMQGQHQINSVEQQAETCVYLQRATIYRLEDHRQRPPKEAD